MDNIYMPRTVEEVFKDYAGRHAALIKALTHDWQDFFKQCDPEKENLCLYGHPNEQWEVNLPAEEVPPELPEPALGINFARDGMNEVDWLCLVAVHSDAWLLAVSFFYAAKFDKHERKRLFNMICDLPTVFDVVTGRKTVKERPFITNGGNKSKSSAKQVKPSKQALPPASDEEVCFEEGDEENAETYCGSCGAIYTDDEFWIACDVCQRWFHGKCVKITPARADHIKQYKCPSCNSNKRARP